MGGPMAGRLLDAGYTLSIYDTRSDATKPHGAYLAKSSAEVASTSDIVPANKDVRLCIDEPEAMGVPVVCGSVVRQMLAITNARYGPSSDFMSIAKVLDEWSRMEMRGWGATQTDDSGRRCIRQRNFKPR